jgi:hypothetical protein
VAEERDGSDGFRVGHGHSELLAVAGEWGKRNFGNRLEPV